MVNYSRYAADIFYVAPDPQGRFAVFLDLPGADGGAGGDTNGGAERVKLRLVADDRHAADTMAAMFNRVILSHAREAKPEFEDQ